jgi:hypothetical protein
VDGKLSTLALAPRTHDLLGPRAARRWPEERPRPFLAVLDLLIDGTSLLNTVRSRLPDFPLVSPFWIGRPLIPFHARALLGEGPSDLDEQDPTDHIALFMCRHCVIGGCGVLSTRLIRDGEQVRWTDIGPQWPKLRELGPFVFDANQYDQVLRPLLAEQPPPPGS